MITSDTIGRPGGILFTSNEYQLEGAVTIFTGRKLVLTEIIMNTALL